MIKLVASDIDGTLIPEGQTKLNPEIYDIIRKLKKHGIHFVVASGRQLNSQQLLFAPVANDISYISENGAICMHEGQQHVITEFDRDLAMRIIEEVDKMPDCKLTISCPSTQYIKSGDDNFYNHMISFLKYDTTIVESFKNINEPIVKIAFWNTQNTQAAYEHFKSLFENEIRVAYGGNCWIDFIPFQSNKGTALKFILEKMNLTPADAVCFGDQQNDVEMLEYTETSYAMAHAKPEIQAHATDITESVEKTLNKLIKSLE